MKEFYKKHKEIIDYIFFGIVTTAVSMTVYKLTTLLMISLNGMHTDEGEATLLLVSIATALQWISGVITAFLTNRAFVFHDKNKNPAYVAKQFGIFAASRVVTWFIDWGLSLAGVALFNKLSLFTGDLVSGDGAFAKIVNTLFSADFIVKCIVAVIVVILNYFISIFLVFRKARQEKNRDEAKENQN